jgi:FAD/FMN-containing dehydrogenase
VAVTGGRFSTTGIAGLTLGSGSGRLERRCGLTADNLLAAEVVTADGWVLTASAEENPDLFCGLRGGGGNFGIVTSFTYQLHQIGPVIFGGLMVCLPERAGEILRFLREYMADAPDDLGWAAAFIRTERGGRRSAHRVGARARGGTRPACDHRRLPELHVRRRRRTGAEHIRPRGLRTTRGTEGSVRPDEPLPPQPEYPPVLTGERGIVQLIQMAAATDCHSGLDLRGRARRPQHVRQLLQTHVEGIEPPTRSMSDRPTPKSRAALRIAR